MLLSLLPGLRHLRAPLFSGLAWIAVLWLTWARHLPPQPQAQGLLKQLYALGQSAGPTVVLSVLAVLAYWLGELWDLLRTSAANLRDKRAPWLRLPVDAIVRWDDAQIVHDFIDERGGMRDLLPYLNVRRSTPGTVDPQVIAVLKTAVETDIEHGVARLLSEKPEVYAEQDRLRSEAALRQALVIPVGVLIPTTMWAVTHAWFPMALAVTAGALVALALVKSARNQAHRSQLVVLGAVLAGTIPAPVLQETARALFVSVSDH